MNDKDILQRFIFENASIRGEIVRLEESYQTIMRQHNYPPMIQRILGEMLVAVSLLSASIKFNGRVTVQFQGKGKLKLLLAQSNQALQIRGLAQWRAEMSEEELLMSLKNGVIAITMDPETEGGQRYQGLVEWNGDSLAQSIEGYFNQSEQIPTHLWFAVNENCAAGLLLQVMPRESTRLGKSVEGQNDWEHLSHLSATITADELLNLDNVVLLHRLYAEEDLRMLDPSSVEFRCTCSIARSENALSLLSEEEVEEELKDKQTIVVTCEFCNQKYHFDRIDVTRIFKRNAPDSSTQMH